MIAPSSIEHQVVSRLIKAGFSPESAAFYWSGDGQSGSVDDIINRIMDRILSDQSADVCAEEETQRDPSSNGEETNPFSGAGAVQTERPTAKPRGNFDVPPSEDEDQEIGSDTDEDEEETLELDLDDATVEDLAKAASDELYNPRTLEQNRVLLAAFPEWLANLLREWMRFVKIPALLPATCVLATISAALMRGLRCWGSRGWVYANLYALLGAESGVGKTLVYDETVRPLEELDEELQDAFKEWLSNIRAELGIIESTIRAKMTAHQKVVKDGAELSEAEMRNFKAGLSALHKEKGELEEQMERRVSLWTSDFTSEILGVLLRDNAEQMSVQSDEGGVALFNLEGKYNEGGQTDDILLCKCFSGNAHKVHRISRNAVGLKRPRCSMLLLLQPDLLHRAFRNERLVVGGFLARTFSIDCRLKMQYELPDEQEPINAQLTAQWNTAFKELYRKFRCAEKPYTIQVEDKVRHRARHHYNAIVQMVRHRLSDISSFAARWTELTWRAALALHAIRYGVECDKRILSETTYESAVSITTIFFQEQLKVLQALRVDKQHNTHNRLQTLFQERQNAPITLRDLQRRHGLEKDEVETCVKTYPDIYGLVNRKSAHGERSTLLFLQVFPPPDI
jgi:hypothetical protein